MYYQPSDGPQLFDLIAPASLGPGTALVLLLCFPVAIAVLTLWFQAPGAAGRATAAKQPRVSVDRQRSASGALK